MPKAVADVLSDQFVGHDVNLQRLQADHRRTLFRALSRLEEKLVRAILEDVGTAPFTFERNKALLRVVRQILTSGYVEISDEHRALLREMGLYEVQAISRLVNRQIGVDLLSVGVSDSVITAMLNDNTIFGAPLKAYWSQQSSSLQARFATEMRAGIFAGETTADLIRRVRGTKAANYKDGLMQVARNGAEVVVRTAAQSVLNDARMEVYKANEDVIAGVQAQVTLDTRTSDICIARSGSAWDLEGNPLPDTNTTENFPGPPPWHPNCRTTLVPVLKSYGELLGDTSLDRELKKLPKSTQSSMDGQVAGDLTYEQWLRDQPESRQLEVLGPGRLKLWRARKISLRDLIDQRGNPMTLKELQET